jgi:hypothetical protein
VIALTRSSGPPGSTVGIQGVGFADATGVSFGGAPASLFTVSDDQAIVAESPPGSGTVEVTVTTPRGTSPAVPGVTAYQYP